MEKTLMHIKGQDSPHDSGRDRVSVNDASFVVLRSRMDLIHGRAALQIASGALILTATSFAPRTSGDSFFTFAIVFANIFIASGLYGMALRRSKNMDELPVAMSLSLVSAILAVVVICFSLFSLYVDICAIDGVLGLGHHKEGMWTWILCFYHTDYDSHLLHRRFLTDCFMLLFASVELIASFQTARACHGAIYFMKRELMIRLA
jgi:hypothetical protein